MVCCTNQGYEKRKSIAKALAMIYVYGTLINFDDKNNNNFYIRVSQTYMFVIRSIFKSHKSINTNYTYNPG